MFEFTQAFVAEGRKAVVANHNLHSLHLLQRDPLMRALYARADLVQIDSMPLIWWGGLLGRPVARQNRSTYTGYGADFWRAAQAYGWRVFHLGGRPGVGARAADALRSRFPGVTIGERHGYFDMTPGGAEAQRVLEEIWAFRPDVVFVGMGMPRQEHWIVQNYEALPNAVYYAIGAAFDYDAGEVAACPPWVASAGFEWLFRFVQEPRRLFARYFLEPLTLAPTALAEAAGELRDRLRKRTPPQIAPELRR